jgi:hypothetical protein
MAKKIDGKAHIRIISEALQGILGQSPAPLHEAPVDDFDPNPFIGRASRGGAKFDPNPFINRASRGGAKKAAARAAAPEEKQAEEFGQGMPTLQISWIEKKGMVKSVYADSSSSDSARLSKADVQALVKLLNELQRKMA